MGRGPAVPTDGLFVHPLSYVRYEQGWSLQDLVNVIARRIGNSAARREKAWRWEHWGVVPDAESQRALADELGVPHERMRQLGWPDWLPAGAGIDVEAPWTLPDSVKALDATANAAMLDRRGFLVLTAGGAAAVATRWRTIEPQQLASAVSGTRIGTTLIDCLEGRLPALRQMDAALGGGSIRAVVDAELRLVTELLAKSSYSEPLGRRLFALAAELGRVAGWTSFDSGLHAAAERYWVAALRAAHTAGDPAIGANILKCMSLQRVDTDHAAEALTIASAAREGATNAPARVVAMLTVRQARTHAVLGETVECERLLASAEPVMGRACDEPAPAWADYFDQAEYCAQVACCYLLLRRHEATDRWLTQSLQLQPRERSRDRATYLIWRADAVLTAGDVEHACDLVGQAIPDIAVARSSRNRRRLTEIQTRLGRYRHHAVDTLNEQIRTMATTA